MKKSALYIFLLFIFLYSCSQNSPNNASSGSNVATSQCYVSATGSDSASLVLNDQYNRINGSLKMYFAGKDNLTGTIAGAFKGDTLFVDYTYRSGDKQGDFRNPFAFLRKDGKLYQGYGEVVTSYGRTSFKKGTPINFDKGFVFNPVDCR